MEPDATQGKSPEPELPPPPTPEQLTEAERLLQQASLARIRQQGSVAEKFLKEAAEAAPGSAAVQAALGDELWRRSQFSKAREAYKMAHRIEPLNAAYETKWAESIVGSGGDPLAQISGLGDSYASAKSAGCLSMILPGLGQIVMGDKNKGIALIVVYVVAWTWAVFTPNGLAGIPAAIGFRQEVHVKEFNALVLLPLAVVAVTWLSAVLSLSSQMKVKAPRNIERPKPPGEGDFEL
jgi:tetratricopeptide (TPR) repeat protein